MYMEVTLETIGETMRVFTPHMPHIIETYGKDLPKNTFKGTTKNPVKKTCKKPR